MKKKLSVFSTHTDTVEFRLYHDDLRRFFDLPVSKGQFTTVVAHESVLLITFESKRNKISNKTIS